MTVDFGIRLSRYPENPAEDAHAYYERTLNSLSEHITTVWLSDHLQAGDYPTFESWVLMAHLAALYPRFRYGHLVNCQSYRNPALLAKMAATMQHLTSGRFIMSLGAGWHKEEYDAYNFDFASPGARVGAACRDHRDPARHVDTITRHILRQALPRRECLLHAPAEPVAAHTGWHQRQEGAGGRCTAGGWLELGLHHECLRVRLPCAQTGV